MKKLLIPLLFLIILAGCSEKPLANLTKDPIEIDMGSDFDPRSVFNDLQDGVEITYEINEKESTCTFVLSKDDKQEVFENISVTLIYPEETFDPLITPYKAKVLKEIAIHGDHSFDSSLAGYVREGDAFEVYEIYQDGDDIWCRIGSRYWICNSNSDYLELITYDEDIDYIKNIVYFADFGSGMDRIGLIYDWYGLDAPFEFYRQQSKEFGYYDIIVEYDEQGRIVSESNGYFKQKYELDNNGNIVHVTTSYGDSFDFAYDDENRIVAEEADYTYSKSSYRHEYDENGNLLSITDDSGYKNIEFEYNGSIRIEDDQGMLFVFRYDDNGNEIERFIAPDGDIRNPKPTVK